MLHIPWFRIEPRVVELPWVGEIRPQPFGVLVWFGLAVGVVVAVWFARKYDRSPKSVLDLAIFLVAFSFPTAFLVDAIAYKPGSLSVWLEDTEYHPGRVSDFFLAVDQEAWTRPGTLRLDCRWGPAPRSFSIPSDHIFDRGSEPVPERWPRLPALYAFYLEVVNQMHHVAPSALPARDVIVAPANRKGNEIAARVAPSQPLPPRPQRVSEQDKPGCEIDNPLIHDAAELFRVSEPSRQLSGG